MAGPMGRDVGLALSFPIACYVAHALDGEVAASIFEYITLLIDCYLDKMEDAGVTGSKKATLYRNIIRGAGGSRLWHCTGRSYTILIQLNATRLLYLMCKIPWEF